MSNRFVRAGLTRMWGGRRSLAVTATAAMLAACVAWPAGAMGADDKPATAVAPKPPAELRVGISPNYPPIAFEEDGKIVGVEADLAERLGK